MNHFRTLLEDFRLTTAEILYHLPDHPELLQSFIWQDYDLPPGYPKLYEFLLFWRTSLDGRLHSVNVISAGHMITPGFRLPGSYQRY